MISGRVGGQVGRNVLSLDVLGHVLLGEFKSIKQNEAISRKVRRSEIAILISVLADKIFQI